MAVAAAVVAMGTAAMLAAATGIEAAVVGKVQ
jgi:hypothetical protein